MTGDDPEALGRQHISKPRKRLDALAAKGVAVPPASHDSSPYRAVAQSAVDAIEAATGWRFLGAGRHRVVFAVDARWVIKIPRTSPDSDDQSRGEADNYYERRQWRRRNDGSYEASHGLAPCRLLPNGWLLMRRVWPIAARIEYRPGAYRSKWRDGGTGRFLPRWITAFDCEQVGWSPSGQVLAYDYA